VLEGLLRRAPSKSLVLAAVTVGRADAASVHVCTGSKGTLENAVGVVGYLGDDLAVAVIVPAFAARSGAGDGDRAGILVVSVVGAQSVAVPVIQPVAVAVAAIWDLPHGLWIGLPFPDVPHQPQYFEGHGSTTIETYGCKKSTWITVVQDTAALS